jgi:GNAT superfamily N-acetyltransferase
VEVRAMLLSSTCEVFGWDDSVGASFAVISPYTRVMAIVGQPPADAIREAIQHDSAAGEVLAFGDNLEYVTSVVGGWSVSPAILHLLGNVAKLPTLEPVGVGAPLARPFAAPHAMPVASDAPDEDITMRMISGDEISAAEGLPEDLRDELMRASLVGSIGATFVNGKAVSFCTAQSETETLWDMGLETLEDQRGRGYASLITAYMVDQLGRRGKRPVWGSEESNLPSMQLASKLGFKPVDRIFVLSDE